MRVLVAGGAGFLGSHLVRALLEQEHEVVVVDSLITGDRENLRGLDDAAMTFFQADVREPVEVPGRFDRVYNLASPASPKDFATLPIEILETGSKGTKNLLDRAARDGARFFQASTSEVYGDPLVHPQTEDYWGNVNPRGKRAVYDEAKRYAEAMIAAYERMGRVEARVVRIFNTYGPRMRLDDGRVLPNFASQALAGIPLTVYGDGSQTRSFCFVDDLVAGFLALMESDVTGPVNLGNPAEITVLEFAEMVVSACGSSSPIDRLPLPHQDDPKRRRPDITRASEALGWRPRTALEDGLPRAIEDFRRRLDAAS